MEFPFANFLLYIAVGECQ